MPRAAARRPDPRTADPAYLAAFEAARAGVLRRRIIICILILLSLLGFSMLGTYFESLEVERGETPLEVLLVGAMQDLTIAAVLISTLVFVFNDRPDRRRLVRGITVCTIISMLVGTYFELRRALMVQTDLLGNPMPLPVDPGLWACRFSLLSYAMLIAVPLVVVPMRLAESARIALGCGMSYVFLIVAFSGAEADILVRYTGYAALVPMLPMLFSHWRYLRFDAQFEHTDLRDRFGQISAELAHARALHEALFPAPITDGPVRVAFAYEPMREIGGDFLFIHRSESASGQTFIVLVDVSGHGVAAALAVNRLHGELVRLCAAAEQAGRPEALSAGDLIAGLNAYVFLTLAPQAVFATAVCVRIDPGPGPDAVAVQWCNAGHPPAFLRSRAGAVHRLGPTTTMLGVLDPDTYEPAAQSMPAFPGDLVLLYTDGLPETRDATGRELGLSRLEAIVRGSLSDSLAPPLATRLTAAAAAHRAGRQTDDTLVVEVLLEGRETSHSDQKSGSIAATAEAGATRGSSLGGGRV